MSAKIDDFEKKTGANTPWPVQAGLAASFVLLMIACALYLLGSAPDRAFSDETQFVLLRVARYLSILLLAFSLCALGFGVRQMVRRPRLRCLAVMALYALAGILGLVLLILNSVIEVAAGGNG
jgi:hypothetical protein